MEHTGTGCVAIGSGMRERIDWWLLASLTGRWNALSLNSYVAPPILLPLGMSIRPRQSAFSLTAVALRPCVQSTFRRREWRPDRSTSSSTPPPQLTLTEACSPVAVFRSVLSRTIAPASEKVSSPISKARRDAVGEGVVPDLEHGSETTKKSETTKGSETTKRHTTRLPSTFLNITRCIL